MNGPPSTYMHSNNQGIFGTTAHCSFGDGNSTRIRSEDEDTPPVASLWDVGVNPQRYIIEPEKTTAPSGIFSRRSRISCTQYA